MFILINHENSSALLTRGLAYRMGVEFADIYTCHRQLFDTR